MLNAEWSSLVARWAHNPKVASSNLASATIFMTVETLDQRGVACPINFVRTKLKLDSMQAGQELEVLLDDGEPIESVARSVVQEGHQVQSKEQAPDQTWKLKVLKV